MTRTEPARATLRIERTFAHPPEKVWRALTEGELLREWLMENDFEPVVGHRFTFRTDPQPHWNGVIDCEVMELIPLERLVYSWCASGDEAATGIRTVVTWMLTTDAAGGVTLSMEQSGFREHETANYRGAQYGWNSMLEALDTVVGGLE